MHLESVYLCAISVIAVASAAVALTKGVTVARERGIAETTIALYSRWVLLLAVSLVALSAQDFLKSLGGEPFRGLSALAGLIGGVCAIAGIVTFVKLYRAARAGAQPLF